MTTCFRDKRTPKTDNLLKYKKKQIPKKRLFAVQDMTVNETGNFRLHFKVIVYTVYCTPLFLLPYSILSEDMDECKVYNNACGDNETCTNVYKSYKCDCKTGYARRPNCKGTVFEHFCIKLIYLNVGKSVVII